MYQLVEKNDNYEIGILGDLVCLRFTENFDRVLGEDRGKGELGAFGGRVLFSNDVPSLGICNVYLPGTRRESDTIIVTNRYGDPAGYAEKYKGALAAYVDSKQPFRNGKSYWAPTFKDGVLEDVALIWYDDEMDKSHLSLGIAFKTEEECKAFIEKTKEFWRGLK